MSTENNSNKSSVGLGTVILLIVVLVAAGGVAAYQYWFKPPAPLHSNPVTNQQIESAIAKFPPPEHEKVREGIEDAIDASNDPKAQETYVAEKTKELEQTLTQPELAAPPPADSPTPTCDELAQRVRELVADLQNGQPDLPNLVAQLDKCRQESKDNPRKEDDKDAKRRRDIAMLLRIAAYIAFATGNPEVGAALMAAAAEVQASASGDAGGNEETNLSDGTSESGDAATPPVVSGQTDPEAQKFFDTLDQSSILKGNAMGNAVVVFGENATELRIIDGRSKADIANVNVEGIPDWANAPNTRPSKPESIQLYADTHRVHTFTYVDKDNKRHVITFTPDGSGYTLTDAP